ncbi:30S ribosomal protein S16 [Candidatus Parcubacteria bacterium]|nr:30S ribosomal protein S16 [Candidatus Parcubacteria bacterium]
MIRFQRIGRTNDPSFRVVLTDRRNSPKSRNFVEILGTMNAKTGKPALDADRIRHWIKMGAQTSPSMHNLLVTEKIVEGKKINVLPKKSPIKKESDGEAAPAAPAAPAQAEAEAPKEEAPAEAKAE